MKFYSWNEFEKVLMIPFEVQCFRKDNSKISEFGIMTKLPFDSKPKESKCEEIKQALIKNRLSDLYLHEGQITKSDSVKIISIPVAKFNKKYGKNK